ncbi:MAG: DUF4402 domain-containing protein [Bdellovibrio sp.]
MLLLYLSVSLKCLAGPLKVTALSDLSFPLGVPGDPAYVISAGTSDNGSNASFRVSGNANQAYSIVLPATATMDFKKGSKSDSILIYSFVSYPAINGVLNNLGQADFFVGATRDALRTNQTAGSYSGHFSVTVVY